MFLKTIRQLVVVTVSDSQIRLEYKCRICNQRCTVTLTNQEYEYLIQGLPFRVVFNNGRKKELIHFSKGICNNEH